MGKATLAVKRLGLVDSQVNVSVGGSVFQRAALPYQYTPRHKIDPTAHNIQVSDTA